MMRQIFYIAGLAAAALHLPYLWWLGTDPAVPLPAALRSMSTLAVAVLLCCNVLHSMTPGARRGGSPDHADGQLRGAFDGPDAWPTYAWLGLLGIVSAAVALGSEQQLWALSVPAMTGALLGLGGALQTTPHAESRLARVITSPTINHRMHAHVALLLACIAFPAEIYLAPVLDGDIQWLTARLAQPLIDMTGLPMWLSRTDNTVVLTTQDLHLHVTALCAGSQTFATTLTLGLVIGGLLLASGRQLAVFVFGLGALSFFANVVRITVSAHAANAWLGHNAWWGIAHDIIGYGTFGVVYGGAVGAVLFHRWCKGAATHTRAKNNPAATSHSMANSMSGHQAP